MCMVFSLSNPSGISALCSVCMGVIVLPNTIYAKPLPVKSEIVGLCECMVLRIHCMCDIMIVK